MRLTFTRHLQLVLCVLLLHCGNAMSQPAVSSTPQRTLIRCTPSKAFQTDAYNRVIIGPLWRDAWATEIQAEELDLQRAGGDLKLERWTGDSTSFRLHFRGADSVRYTFRTLQRPPGSIFPPEVLIGYAPGVLNELVAATYPYADLVISVLAHAIEIPFPDVRIVAVTHADTPLSTAAGSHGRLGMFYRNLTAERTELLPNTRSVEVLAALDSHEAIDAAEVLKLRLLDLLVGSWHEGSATWRWVSEQRSGRRFWKPLVSSHPLAFSMFGGAVGKVSGFLLPALPECDHEYPDVNTLVWSEHVFDRKVLSGLSRGVYDSVASYISHRISDSVIEDAIDRIPPERRGRDGELLRGILRERRTHLPDIAQEFYLLLAQTVDVHVPKGIDRIGLYRPDATHLEVDVVAGGSSDSTLIVFSRLFHAQETNEVRIHAGDEISRVRHSGLADNDLSVIVVDKPDMQGTGTGQTDNDDHGSLFEEGILVARPKESEDRGSSWNLGVMADYNTEAGALLGFGPVYYRYGFRAVPYSWTFSSLVGYAPFSGNGRIRFFLDSRSLIRGASVTVNALASGYEMSGFFGIGNETEEAEGVADGYFHPHLRQYRLASGVSYPVASTVRFGFMGTGSYVRAEELTNRYVNIIRPYGVDGLAYFGIGGTLEYDSRDDPVNPQHGVLVRVSGLTFPRTHGLTGSFGKSHYEVRVFAGGTGVPAVTVAARVLGEKAWGSVPYYELPNLGGWSALRGFANGRFIGGAMAMGTLELRTSLGHLDFIVPSSFGVNCFVETGRVFVEGESSRRWHASFGGTFWLAPWARDNAMSMIVAGSSEGIEIYFDVGVGF
jgi:hypothetical protein